MAPGETSKARGTGGSTAGWAGSPTGVLDDQGVGSILVHVENQKGEPVSGAERGSGVVDSSGLVGAMELVDDNTLLALGLTPGEHEIIIEAPDHVAQDIVVMVLAGSTIEVTVTLEERPAPRGTWLEIDDTVTPEGILSVHEALAVPSGTAVRVEGTLQVDARGDIHLCDVLLTSVPPACAQPSLRVLGLDLADAEGLTRYDDGSATAMRVVLMGRATRSGDPSD